MVERSTCQVIIAERIRYINVSYQRNLFGILENYEKYEVKYNEPA